MTNLAQNTLRPLLAGVTSQNNEIAMIRPVSSTVSAPAWFNDTPIKRLDRMRWKHHTTETTPTTKGDDHDFQATMFHHPDDSTWSQGEVSCVLTEEQRDEREILGNNGSRENEYVTSREEVPDKEQELPFTYPVNDGSDGDGDTYGEDSSNMATDQTISSASLTTLAAFSLITPPDQWIQKDSFLHRRKKLEQWGIPLPKEIKKTTLRRLQTRRNVREHEKILIEETLQERLVWIKYQNKYWWPAIRYDNYRQLLQDESLSEHVWYRLPLFWKRFDLAIALVFHKNDPRNHMQVARVLGRGNTNESGTQGTIEIVEVEETWPFNDETKVADVFSKMALNGDFFRDHPTLYLDWHRAMDQMELLLRECLGIDVEQKEQEYDPKMSSYRAKSKERYRRKKEAQAVAATLTAITNPDSFSKGDDKNNDNNKLDDNSLVASTIASSKVSFLTSGHQPEDIPVENRKRTWLQRAKEAEHKQWVAKCNDCSTLVSDSLAIFCVLKDDLPVVATALQQPQGVEQNGLQESQSTPRQQNKIFCAVGEDLETRSLYYAARQNQQHFTRVGVVSG